MPRANPAADWSRLMFDASQLWAEAGMVVALRSWRMMGGGHTARREFERMISEKVEAGSELTGVLASGRPGLRAQQFTSGGRSSRFAEGLCPWREGRR